MVTENIQQREVRHANSFCFTMVAVDDNRKPVAVPPLELSPPRVASVAASDGMS